MKCPHCLVEFHDQPAELHVGRDRDGEWSIKKCTCPACRRLVLNLLSAKEIAYDSRGTYVALKPPLNIDRLIYPKGSSRTPCPPEVPPNLRVDYVEACMVLPDSAKSAAALGRRCLQTLLRDTGKVKHGNLADEIQQVLDSGKLPSGIYDSIDAIRNIGNFAAHPMKSTQTGAIIDVEPGEAEWTLDVLEALFDFYFVAPAALQKKKDAFNKKLEEAGKPPMK